MSILAPSPKQYFNTIHTDFFSLSYFQTKHKTKFFMRMKIDIMTTKSIPSTYHLLKKRFPQVLKTICFNDENLPFHVEVNKTEMGHLFEHILIEYLCIYKVLQGEKDAVISGITSWNWIKNERGTFNITVNSGINDSIIFSKALKNSIILTNELIESSFDNFSTYQALYAKEQPSENYYLEVL